MAKLRMRAFRTTVELSIKDDAASNTVFIDQDIAFAASQPRADLFELGAQAEVTVAAVVGVHELAFHLSTIV